jgi:hypothetical protein
VKENETNVAPEATSPEPAKTAENEPAGELAASSPGAAIAAPEETPVSPLTAAQVADMIEEQVSTARAEIEDVRETLRAEIEQLRETLRALLDRPAEPPKAMAAAAAIPSSEHELAVGAPVKIWSDARHKNFHLGKILAIHGEGDAFDVQLDDAGGGTITKIPAGGLEFDDRG